MLAAAACLALSACGSKADAPTGAPSSGKEDSTISPAVSGTPSPTPISESTPTPTPAPTYHITIHDNRSKGIHVELDIQEGEDLNFDTFPKLIGYDFKGCYDELGEQCIDSTGKVCAELLPDNVLYARYDPKDYTLSFTYNGENATQYGIPNITAPYDTNLRDLLPLDKIIGDAHLIYAVYYNETRLADLISDGQVLLNEATFQNSDIFTGDSKITLDLRTTPVHAQARHDAQEVCIRDDLNQFEQRFKDEYICDSLSLASVDFPLLKTLGYNTASIEITCQVKEKDDGNQEIYVYHTAYENNENDGKKEKKQKEKAMKDFLLAKESHDCDKKDVTETVTLTIDVPLSKLEASDGIYVYYGASGFGEDDWYRVSTDIKITFQKITE